MLGVVRWDIIGINVRRGMIDKGVVEDEIELETGETKAERWVDVVEDVDSTMGDDPLE